MKEKHPRALYTLFFTEMWERFSYYGMRALLILYMTRQILYGDSQAYGIYAAYGALVYATPFIGGVIADQILGYRKAIILGAVLMAIGHFLMAIESEVFFFGALAFLIIGNGFFKPNISSMVGSLYKPGDPRRDGGFTIFYMGINLGAFLAPLACGLLGELLGWHYGFGLAGIGMVMGLIVFVRGQNKFEPTNGMPPNPEKLTQMLLPGINRERLIYIGAFLITPLIGLLVWKYELMAYVLTPFAIIVFAGILIMSFSFEKIERQRVWVILILAFFSITFWAFFEQAGSSITLFTANNVNRFILGFEVPTSVFQSVNPMFIIIFAPIFASLWIALGKRDKEPNTTIKFALGIIQLGLGFGVFVLGAQLAGPDGMVALVFLLFGYLLHTTGELCISPVGLSMVTKLAPARIVSMVMGAWFLSFAMAQHVGGMIARLTSTAHYMETGITYEPSSSFTGKDQFSVRTYYVNGNDTLRSEPMKMLVDVVAERPDEVAPKPEVFYLHRSVKPGEQFNADLRIPYLDPTGRLTEIEFTRQPSHGQMQFSNDTIVYSAHAISPENTTNTEMQESMLPRKDTITFIMKEINRPERFDKVALVITISDDEAFHPVVINPEQNYTVIRSTALRTSFNTFNVLHNFYMPNGKTLGVEIVEEPQNGFVKTGSMLNPFVGPTKTIHIYSNVFYYLFLISIGVGIFVFLMAPLLKKWMHGVH
ncbi:MAG: peptide MFS transporter [Bacteroidetes bacterium]|nr:MAG: peptide MFS transporter [Bacteroidota bacterium]